MPESNVQKLEALRRGVEEENSQEVDSLVAQIQEARKDIETSFARLAGLADNLRTRARRVPSNASSSLVIFANAHLRFSAAASQGMRRTASMDRVLDRAKVEQEEARRQKERERLWAASREAGKAVEQLTLPTGDAFDELYSEVVSNAE